MYVYSKKKRKKEMVSVRMHPGQHTDENRSNIDLKKQMIRRKEKMQKKTKQKKNTFWRPEMPVERQRATQKDRLTDEGPCPV